MLKDYHSGESTPNVQDSFPRLKLLPIIEGCTGFLLKLWKSLWFDLLSAKGCKHCIVLELLLLTRKVLKINSIHHGNLFLV